MITGQRWALLPWKQIQEKLHSWLVWLQKQAEQLISSFEAPLKEFVRAVKSAKSVMSDRSTALGLLQQVTMRDGTAWHVTTRVLRLHLMTRPHQHRHLCLLEMFYLPAVHLYLLLNPVQ